MNVARYKYVVLDGEGVSTLALSGEIDYAATLELLPVIDKLIQGSNCDLHLDLEKVTFIDSEGIKMLLSAMYRLQQLCRTAQVIRQSKCVERVVSLAGVQQQLGLHDTATSPPSSEQFIWRLG